MPPWPSFFRRRKSPRTICLVGAAAGASLAGPGVSPWKTLVGPPSSASLVTTVFAGTGRFSMRVLRPAAARDGRNAGEWARRSVLGNVAARTAGADLLQHLRRAVHHEL